MECRAIWGECEYVNVRRIIYSDDYAGDATFVPICVKCHRFVKADDTVKVGDAGLSEQPNATCSKCGRTWMHFEGFM